MNEFDAYPFLFQFLFVQTTLSEEVFEEKLSQGWRFLGKTTIRHSTSSQNGQTVFVIPGRIRLRGFTFTASQKKLLRRGKRDLKCVIEQKALTHSDVRLFKLHSCIFTENAPLQLNDMVHPHPEMPVPGLTVRLYSNEEHIATSWFHLSRKVADSSYCVYDTSPKWNRYSLGQLTMLLELEFLMQQNYAYYYLGYRYQVPSKLDYKANFNNLERYWRFEEWVSTPRLIPNSITKL